MKKQKLHQSGRSMVEILGVLAIIGVLSVGGIYAYNIIWNKMMVNKLANVMQMFSLSVTGERTIYDALRGTDGKFYGPNNQRAKTTELFANTYGFKMKNGHIPLGNGVSFWINIEDFYYHGKQQDIFVLFINWPSNKPKIVRAVAEGMRDFIKSNSEMRNHFHRLLNPDCDYSPSNKTDEDIDAGFEKFTAPECTSYRLQVYFRYKREE